MHKLLLTKGAEKELEKLPRSVQKRIATALDELVTLGHKASNVKALKTPFPGFRKRVGDYRILFEVRDEIVVVYKVSKRANVYR